MDAHALEQLVERERLGDVIDRTGSQSRDLRLRIGARAQHHHRQGGLDLHQLAQDRDAIPARQHHVEQHQRRLLPRSAAERGVAVGHGLHGIALTGQPARHEARDASLVFDDQDVHVDQTPSVFATPRSHPKPVARRGQVPQRRVADTTVTRLSESVTGMRPWAEARCDRNEASPRREPTRMTIRPIALIVAVLATLAFAQAAAAQPITLHVTSARTVTNQPAPAELTGTISLAPNTTGSGTPVTGTGTLFTSELHTGDLIKPYTAPGAVPRWLVVASIASDTSLRSRSRAPRRPLQRPRRERRQVLRPARPGDNHKGRPGDDVQVPRQPGGHRQQHAIGVGLSAVRPERHAEQLPVDLDPSSLRLDRRSSGPLQPDDRLSGPRARLEPGRHERRPGRLRERRHDQPAPAAST